MNVSRLVVPVLLATLVGACSRNPPPEPAPTGPTAEELAQRRADSLAAVQQAREDSIARVEAAAAAERQAQEQRMAAARETLREMVFFNYDESALTPEAERVLRNKVEILRASPAVELRIEGHADERGSTEYNIALANRRAESVRDYFTGFGLDADRFSIVSYGEERPLVMGEGESVWSRNRRAEFVITDGENQINPVMQ